jgi:hypothetical protein
VITGPTVPLTALLTVVASALTWVMLPLKLPSLAPVSRT